MLRGLALILMLAGGVGSAGGQPVQGDVRSVGFEAATGGGLYVIRHGQWFPMLVELTGQGSQNYEVELRCEREDLDGDRVVYVEPYVAVTAGAGMKRVWCYAARLGKDVGQQIEVEVIDQRDGGLITTLRAPLAEPISADTMLVLDISDNRFTALNALDSGAVAYNDRTWGARPYYRSICVASLRAGDLPDRWWGLEAVDVVVWDEPDPDRLSNAQLAALVQWVRNGGQLVIGIGPKWNDLQKSVVGEIMPLAGARPVEEVRSLREFTRTFGRDADRQFDAPIAVAVGEPVKAALVTFQDRLPDRTTLNLIALRHVGSGRVLATAARLRDLASISRTRDFLGALIDLNPNESEFNKAEGEKGWSLGLRSLYEPIVAEIEFRRLASARVLAAFAFVAAYILLSTFGTWSWLKRHALTHVSWTAFAVFAAVASALSLGAVGLLRGVTGSVHNYSFVDLEAGSTEARATAYFGYKSNRRQRVDISLPGDENYLRPLATGPEDSAVEYATPVRYAALTGQATLSDTLMRATLKQFEGFWQGTLQGSVRGSLTVERGGDRAGRVTESSWLQSDLDVEIAGGYLLYIDPRLRGSGGEVPARVAGLTGSFQAKYKGSETVPPAVNVLAVRIPEMKPGQKVDRLGTGEYEQYETERRRWNLRGADAKAEPMLPTLWHYQVNEWASRLGFATIGGVDPRDAAALLASTRNLYLHNGGSTDFSDVGSPVSTRGLIDQDVTHWLTRNQAVLLLLVNRPGPATLHLNGKPAASSEGHSLCRVRVPIEYVGVPQRGNPE